MAEQREASVAAPKCSLMRFRKRCCPIKTSGQWSWKSKSAKECVITHLPNGVALKMDGAEADGLDRALWVTMESQSPTIVEERGVSPRAVQSSAAAQKVTQARA